MDVRFVVALVIAYLLGSIPFAQIIAKYVSGVDLRQVGSKNVGTRNLSRTAGLGWGALGAVLDFAKGLAAMVIAAQLALYPWSLAAGVVAVAGHNWPIWLRFRGGKGLATAGGATSYIAFFPELFITVAIGWLVLRAVKNIAITAIASFAIMLILVRVFGRPIEITWFILGLGLAVFLATIPDLISIVRKQSIAKRRI